MKTKLTLLTLFFAFFLTACGANSGTVSQAEVTVDAVNFRGYQKTDQTVLSGFYCLNTACDPYMGYPEEFPVEDEVVPTCPVWLGKVHSKYDVIKKRPIKTVTYTYLKPETCKLVEKSEKE